VIRVAAPDLLAACWTTAGDAAPLRGDEVSPVAIQERIAAVAAAGWQGFGINHADLAATRIDPGWPALRSMVDDNGLRYVELEFLGDWWTEGERRTKSDAVRAELLAAAEILQPRQIKVGAELTGSPVDGDRFAAEFDRLCSEAAASGTRIALEPMPWTNLPTIEAGVNLVTEVGNPAGGLCVDIWHVYRAGNDPSDLAGILTPDVVFTVELDDADRQVVGTLFEDTCNNRRLCGEGIWDVPAFILTMRDVGYEGPWGVEIISDEHRARPIEEAVRVARNTTLDAFAAADRRRPNASGTEGRR